MNALAQGTPTQYNWFQILRDLQLRGYPNARVARRLGVAKNTVHGWKMGAHPAHALGEALIALHQEAMANLPLLPPPKPAKKRVRNRGARKRARVVVLSG